MFDIRYKYINKKFLFTNLISFNNDDNSFASSLSRVIYYDNIFLYFLYLNFCLPDLYNPFLYLVFYCLKCSFLSNNIQNYLMHYYFFPLLAYLI